MALFADFMAAIVAAYVLFRCVDIASKWLVRTLKDTSVEHTARIILGIVNVILAGVTFLWTAWWFYNMVKMGIEVGKALSETKFF